MGLARGMPGGPGARQLPGRRGARARLPDARSHLPHGAQVHPFAFPDIAAAGDPLARTVAFVAGLEAHLAPRNCRAGREMSASRNATLTCWHRWL